MASIRDVAQKAGVGVGTVSRVINGSGYVAEKTREKIENAIHELEYTPNELARNLFKNRTGIIGVLVPDLDHPFFSAFARETEIALYNKGYKAMVCNTIGSSNRELDYLNMLDRNMVDGIITGSHTLHVDEYRRRKHTIVSLDQDFGPEIPMVGSDHTYGGALAAEILIKNKCRKVLHIAGVAPNVAAKNKDTTFKAILTEHGVEVVDLMMEWNKFDHLSYWEIAKEAIRKYDGIDGIFSTDQPALHYMHLAMKAGKRVPEDLKVVTYDGMDIARLCYPEVTCIDQNVKFLAETCTDTVLGLIEDKERVPQKQIIGVEFHQGQTTYPVELNGIF
nr:LacI family DNA-binding transcriptional regulator [uncultured Blautia sp.]